MKGVAGRNHDCEEENGKKRQRGTSWSWRGLRFRIINGPGVTPREITFLTSPSYQDQPQHIQLVCSQALTGPRTAQFLIFLKLAPPSFSFFFILEPLTIALSLFLFQFLICSLFAFATNQILLFGFHYDSSDSF